MKGPPRLALALGVLVVVALTVVAALLMVGGPGTARLERLDELRLREAVELVNAIERHRIFTGRLPESLDAVRAGLSGPPPIRDPETGEPYGYEALGERRFRVCTRLSMPDAALPRPAPIRISESRRIATVVSDPESGRVCWESAEAPD